jgi:hypothetical protein
MSVRENGAVHFTVFRKIRAKLLESIRRMRFWTAAAYLFLAIVSGTRGAEAVFSLDEKSVFLITPKGLLQLNLPTKSAQKIAFPTKFDSDKDYGLSLSNAGYPLLAADDGLWAYDPEKSKWTRIYRGPADLICTDLAYNPANSSIVFQTSDRNASTSYWLLQKDAEKPVQIRLRRVRYLSGPGFDSQGRLFFGYSGDLWMGSICKLPEEQQSDYWVCGIRIAPLADLETSFGTPSNQGVEMVAPLADRIYVHLRRLGGSGWGNIASVATPPLKFTDGEPEDDSLEKRLVLYQEELKSIRFLGENGSYGFLCASRSGAHVFYRASDPKAEKMKLWLLSGQQTEEIGDDSLIGMGE